MKFIPAFNHVQVIVGESTDELIALTMVLLDTLQDVGLLQRCYQYYSDRLQFRHPHSIRLLKMELYDGSRGLQMPVFGGTI